MEKFNTPLIEPIIPFPQTPETAREYIAAHGLCVSEIARKHGLHRLVLFDLLRGKRKGQRKQSHVGAVLLGLKKNPEQVT
ncbi:DNA-binding protein [Betaproteobacteria bacterium]|nr:DNA-binding protein [Betaproteobacteria bacterium]